MKWIVLLLILACNAGGSDMKQIDKNLTDFQKSVLFEKNTERPFSGQFNDFYEDGYYTCANCHVLLYQSTDKFKSSCGWPSFDDEIEGAVKHVPDADGHRTEIVCANCNGHLGHVFKGEGFTDKNVRHCVNSASMNFVSAKNISRAYVAGGCFWGVEFYLEQLSGVLSATSGYMGGFFKNPTYREICTGKTGHKEVVEVLFDSTKISYRDVLKRFFEIHDPTQIDGQGPDIGEQYLSAVFTSTQQEKTIVNELIKTLEKRGYAVATEIEPSSQFYAAEDYHQNYYEKKGSTPYCHVPVDRFGE